ncbi:hypothetical protein AAE478_002588 [Parahypoxylon ruwenzoriense]
MLESTSSQSEGTFAATLRYHDHKFYLITFYMSYTRINFSFALFITTDPHDDAAWVGPIRKIYNPWIHIDPDIFWDDDGSVHIASSGIHLQQLNLTTLETTAPVQIWSGTGGAYPEGPHLCKNDGWYYILIAEGGTEINQSVIIARSRNVYGPYESYGKNPILTNRNTDEYFQTVGHADLFQDGEGNWWRVALSTRSGPDWTNYPMGRESVLFPVTWEAGEWPSLEPIRGEMNGLLPSPDKNLPGKSARVGAGDVIDFEPGSEIPSHFVHWRPAPNPSRANLTPHIWYSPKDGQTFIARLRSHSLFEYSVDFSFSYTDVQQEAGIPVFLTNYQHLDLSIMALKAPDGQLRPHLQFRAETIGKLSISAPAPVVFPLPDLWVGRPVRLRIEAKDNC